MSVVTEALIAVAVLTLYLPPPVFFVCARKQNRRNIRRNSDVGNTESKWKSAVGVEIFCVAVAYSATSHPSMQIR